MKVILKSKTFWTGVLLAVWNFAAPALGFDPVLVAAGNKVIGGGAIAVGAGVKLAEPK